MEAVFKPTEPIEILLVEDNPGDVRLAEGALKEGKVRNRMSVAWDGEEAVRFLRREGEFASAPRPDLILLDLNLPRKDGREVLREIKEDPELMRIPVVILTISQDEQDILDTYNHHANCYIVKPVDFEPFMGAIRSVEDFWLEVVKLPPNHAR